MVELEELWVTIDGLENYEVSNFGRVFSIKTGREIKPQRTKKGYYKVQLYRNGRRYDCFVHRLVAKCFFLNYAEGVEVKHIDQEHKEDNGVLNLTLGDGCRKGAKK